MEGVVIGVDPHKLSATIEVVDDHERMLGQGRFTTDRAGYAAMRTYAKAWPVRVWAVEGANGVGRPLAQRLLESGEHVVDVPAKLAARVRLFDTGHNRKTDAHDAHSIAMVAVRTRGLRVLEVDGELEALRLLVERREALTRRRVQIVDRLQALLAELLPGQAKKDLTTGQGKRMLASVRPRDIAGKTRRRIAAEELTELVAVETKMKKATAELKSDGRRPRLAPDRHPRHRPGRRCAGPGRRRRRRPIRRPEPVRVMDRHRPTRRVLGGAEPAPAVPGRQPTGQPRHPHRRDHPTPPRHRRPGLLPTQASRGQEAPGSAAVPQTTDLRRHLPTAGRGRRGPRSKTSRRAREGTAGRHFNPARPAHTRTPTLRISHFPDPHQRRYAPPRRPRKTEPTKHLQPTG